MMDKFSLDQETIDPGSIERFKQYGSLDPRRFAGVFLSSFLCRPPQLRVNLGLTIPSKLASIDI